MSMENQEIKKKRVSYSQYSIYLKCPHRFYLDYICNLREKEDSIHTTFGTAIHHAFQTYLTSLYKESVATADSLDVKKLFLDKFTEEAKKIKVLDEQEFTDFTFDGYDIIDTFLKSANRIKHFPSDQYELIGVEIPLEISIKNNVEFVGFIDLVLKEKNKENYRIIDFKTSSSGWNKYQKEDESKYSQLHLYKSVYSKKFNVPLNNIDVEFFIVKRKLFESSTFPQSRIQIYKPMSGPLAIKESINNFIQFLDYGFNQDGSYNVENSYPKIPGDRKKNCKYCPHYKKKCDAKADKL
jgi:hypothetical protein